MRPITSRDHVSRFLLGLMRQLDQQGDVHFELASINGDTGVIVRSSGSLDTIVLLQVEDGAARGIYFIRNPDKLTHM
ncbi:hypothetical protein QNH46_06070 [Paenibacillus woosongensis]|uniref:Uncharacterized protein n=1 Tax=Paenibacillus woosongensis TaxID=307580 RepID=A0AA95KUN9_9BACL|nr:hypothetical protein [Paenibacillus woosongensis]WHX50228.1 hypothetical protein QNH46_06070 [Paenibacillus woosongensis]